MSKHLYRVAVSVTLYVTAADEHEAARLARHHAGEESWHSTVDVREVTGVGDCDRDWLPGIPYGNGDDERTVREIVDEMGRVREEGER
jgi:hypothetical protein